MKKKNNFDKPFFFGEKNSFLNLLNKKEKKNNKINNNK
jgi:hypothetical protein